MVPRALAGADVGDLSVWQTQRLFIVAPLLQNGWKYGPPVGPSIISETLQHALPIHVYLHVRISVWSAINVNTSKTWFLDFENLKNKSE